MPLLNHVQCIVGLGWPLAGLNLGHTWCLRTTTSVAVETNKAGYKLKTPHSTHAKLKQIKLAAFKSHLLSPANQCRVADPVQSQWISIQFLPSCTLPVIEN